jgi:hypothetical protein
VWLCVRACDSLSVIVAAQDVEAGEHDAVRHGDAVLDRQAGRLKSDCPVEIYHAALLRGVLGPRPEGW